MLAIFLVLVLCLSSKIEARLLVGFYLNSCPNEESIFQEEARKAFLKDRGMAAGLVRMHFHYCFVRGCDASVLIKSTPGHVAEEDGPPNAGSLRGFEVIESEKARLEKECRGLVSCADILAYAARDSVLVTGGLRWDVPARRRDGLISCADETLDMPAPFHNTVTITETFARKNMPQNDMIALLVTITHNRHLPLHNIQQQIIRIQRNEQPRSDARQAMIKMSQIDVLLAPVGGLGRTMGRLMLN